GFEPSCKENRNARHPCAMRRRHLVKGSLRMDKLQELLKTLSEAADDAAISASHSRLEQDELVAAKDEIAARMLGIRDGKIEVNEVGADGKPVSPVEVVKSLRAAHDTITAELAARAEAARLEAEEMAKATEDLVPAAEET